MDAFTTLLILSAVSIIAAFTILVLKINKALKMEWNIALFIILILLGAAFLMFRIAAEISAAV